MLLFWERGYESASLSEIVEAAGLNKSSLYNTFGSKDELFHRALDRYLEMRSAMLAEFAAGERGLDDLIDVIELMRAEVTGADGSRGCLGVNSSAELGNQSEWIAEYSNRYRATMRETFRSVIERAVGLGEIDAGLAEVYVEALTSMAMATALTARGGASSVELHQQMDAIVALVNSWHLADR